MRGSPEPPVFQIGATSLQAVGSVPTGYVVPRNVPGAEASLKTLVGSGLQKAATKVRGGAAAIQLDEKTQQGYGVPTAKGVQAEGLQRHQGHQRRQMGRKGRQGQEENLH